MMEKKAIWPNITALKVSFTLSFKTLTEHHTTQWKKPRQQIGPYLQQYETRQLVIPHIIWYLVVFSVYLLI